ncbi:MAG TPA: complex I subunit 1 family protein [Polyangiaceae bacterium]|nr:complex I subunit 1 family protein [Polyangiaceae bacterium]
MKDVMDFITSSTFLLPFWGFVKALAAGMFGLNVGVVLTWVERRMRGMVQDSIGPNRAAIPLPGFVAAGAATGPAILLALGVGAAAYLNWEDAQFFRDWGMVFLQAGIFLGWMTTALIARVVAKRGAANEAEKAIGDLGGPRTVFYFGLLAHAAAVLLPELAVGLRLITAEQSVQMVFGAGVALLIFALLAGAGHVGANLAKEKTVRVTLLGLLHPAADGLKTAFKADFIPEKGDWLLFNLAPWISSFATIVVIGVVPFGPSLCFGQDASGVIDFGRFQGIESVGHACRSAKMSLQVADLNVGILYYFALGGVGIVGAALAGWASDNKFSLLGGLRAASQMISYEVTLGLTVIGCLMVYGTVRVDEMVLWQAQNSWGIFVQPLAFFLFITAAIAETKRVPFDIPEGESEIVAGYFTEYAGMKFAMFFFSEFISVVGSSALMTSLFFGGWHLPFFTAHGVHVALGDTVLFSTRLEPSLLALLGVLTFIGKTIGLCLLQVLIRWTLPRFRYDQLMKLGWRKLLPASLVNVMVTAVVMLALQSGSAELASGAAYAAQLSMLLLGLLGLAAPIALVVFLAAPTQKQRLVVNSAARYAASLGGTREANMEA